jgi:hypothetical protein
VTAFRYGQPASQFDALDRSACIFRVELTAPQATLTMASFRIARIAPACSS